MNPGQHERLKYEDQLEDIQRYVYRGVPLGGFLEAIISNDLSEAFARADFLSRHRIFDLVKHVWNNIPGSCWGSSDKYKKWLKSHQKT